MVGEFDSKRKNIVSLFIFLIIIFLFLYKGFISDSKYYQIEYENYLLSINATNKLSNKIVKRSKLSTNNKIRNSKKDKKKIPKEFEEMENIYMEIKSVISKSSMQSKKIIEELRRISENDKIKNNIDNIIQNINETIITDNSVESLITVLNEKLKNLRLNFE